MRRTLLTPSRKARLLLGLLFSALSIFAISQAHADSTVPALSAGTSLTTASMYAANAGANDNKLGFTTTVFDIATGALTLKAGGVTTAMLTNPSMTVNSVSCTLAGSCTVQVAIGSGVTGLGTGVATALAAAMNSAAGPIGTLTPTLNNCVVGNGTAWTSASCPGGGGGSSAFSSLTSGTNTTAAMVVGTGGSLGTAGSGSITATAAPLSGVTGLGTNVGTALAATLNGASGPIGILTPTSSNCVVGNGTVWTSTTCPSGAGGAGFGVDGGTSASSVTAGGIIGNGVRLVKVSSGWASGTLTLPAISAVSADTCIRIEDGGAFVDGTHTLTVAAGAADAINGGSTGGNTGAFVANGSRIDMCVTATHNWNGSFIATAPTTAPSHQFFNVLSSVGALTSAQPAFTDLSGTNSVAQIAGSGASHAVPVDVAGTPTWKVIADCVDTGGNHLNYTQSTDAFSCGTSGGGGGGALTITDGTHSVTSTTTLTTGSGTLVGGSAGSATLNLSVKDVTKTTSYQVAATDMANALALGGTTATLTLPAASSSIFAPGMSTSVSVKSSGAWTVTNSTGLAAGANFPSSLAPGSSGTFVANNDGTTLDYFPGQVGVAAVSHEFVSSITASGPQLTQPACADLSNSVASCSTLPTYSATIGWPAAINPNNNTIMVMPANATITSIVGAVEVATGGTATVSVNKAASGTACSAGTTLHSGSFDANGTAATNQTLTVTTSSISSGNRLCLQTTGTTTWTAGTGIGGITVNYTIP